MAAPREQLAQMLSQARSDAGYGSHARLAKQMTVSRSVVSKAESARQPVPSDAVLTAWAEATGADLVKLTELAHRARSPRSWFAKWADDFEPRATLIRWFEPLLVPGLIQTESYARAVLTWKPDSASADASLSKRLERQSVLDRAELRVVILGSVLNREVGDASVMAEQMEYLLSAGTRPSVTIQIVPDTPGVAGALGGAFAISTEDTTDVAAFTDSIVKGGVYTDHDVIARAVRVFDGLRADALPWTQTQDLLTEAGKRWTI
ncbi:MAG TPA: helix-turn-helix transcriptional regulator [Streptosporangiaceae bacterium]|nr:helix-turn-helix transcriptional regulator [Streptosporangiaceae bacterium]